MNEKVRQTISQIVWNRPERRLNGPTKLYGRDGVGSRAPRLFVACVMPGFPNGETRLIHHIDQDRREQFNNAITNGAMTVRYTGEILLQQVRQAYSGLKTRQLENMENEVAV